MKTKLILQPKLKQQQTLNLALQQALHVLQLPILELATWVQLQIEENPLLQMEDSTDLATELDFETQGFEILSELDETFVQAIFPEEPTPPEIQIPAPISLYDHLMGQARSAFSSPQDLAHAEQIIGHLDHQGFLDDFNADPLILAKIQTFDPPGIAARSLQECLLIQLKDKKDSLAHLLVADHFEDLLQCRWSSLARHTSLTIPVIQKVLRQDLSSLDFHPASKFHPHLSIPLIPDIILDSTDTGLQININEESLPHFTLSAPPTPDLKPYYTAGKWMKHVLSRRRKILTQIMQSLLDKHPDFFSGTANPKPLPMHQIANELGLHTSTIARAVKDKTIACPQGLFPLKHFFPHASTTQNKTISHLAAKELLHTLIAAEDKQKPHSDHALVRLMAEAGIPCARRTIAKYRRALKIPTSSQRKNH